MDNKNRIIDGLPDAHYSFKGNGDIFKLPDDEIGKLHARILQNKCTGPDEVLIRYLKPHRYVLVNLIHLI